MKKRSVGIFLVVLLMGLVLPGCVSKAEYNELKASVAEQETLIKEQADQIAELEAQIAEQEAEIAGLKGELGVKDARLTELEEEKAELQAEIDKLKESISAKIEITCEPNRVTCQNKTFRWKVILTEVNGVGVKLKKCTVCHYYKDGSSRERNYNSSWIEEWLPDAYLPAYGSASFKAGTYCEGNQALTHVIYIISGIDDHAHKITATGRVDIQH